MSYTLDEIMKELREIAQYQISTMNDMLAMLDNAARKPQPDRRILDATMLLTVSKMKLDNTEGLLEAISDVAKKRAEDMKNESNT